MTGNGQVFGGEEHLDAARDAWLAVDVAEALQREDHLVHGRRAELEMALHVGLGRGTAVDAGIRRGARAIPAAPGQLERVDYEYRRNGTVNLFVAVDATGRGAR